MNNTAISANKEKLIFKNESHRKFYEEWLPKCRYQDVYHKALVYCLGINEDTRNHINEIYDFKNGCVQTECLQQGWNTSGSVKVIRMAFNLYCNGRPKNYILQLHKILYSHMNNPIAGQTKTVQNYISATYPDGHTEVFFTPMAPFETPEALEKICEEYNRVIGNLEVEPLIAIPVFIHDFLCIHPFNDGNGRMSRLLTTLLLYRSGFYVGKYISLEAKIAKNKDLYYEVLGKAQNGWHEGEEDVVPFIKYLLGTILAAYKDFEDRFEIIGEKLPALEMVRKATKNKIGKFSKQDIRELCPSLSISSIEGSLRTLVKEGELMRGGSGKATYYVRLM